MEQAIGVVGADGRTVDARWTVDLAAAGRVSAWARESPALLAQEVAEMAAYFPRWVLTAGDGKAVNRCARCQDVLVFRDGKLACVRCGRVGKGSQLAWMGHLPLPVDGLPQALARIMAHATPGFPLVRVGGTQLWLVPVVAFHPTDWPRSEPILRYDRALFSILNIPATATNHIIDQTRMCLYGWSQWRAVTVRVVLQQRVVNHLASLLKVADGQPAATAFAGKAHSYGGRGDEDYGDYR